MPGAPRDDGAATSDRPPLDRARRLYSVLFVALMGGLAAAIFAWYETVNAAAAGVCSPSATVSCAKVGASGHTTLLGVPDWSIGIAGYLLMIVVAAIAYRSYDRRFLTLLAVLSTLGIGVSLYFVYTEAFVIHALCPVCTTAHLLNVVVLIVTLSLLRLSAPEAGAPHHAPRGAPDASPPA